MEMSSDLILASASPRRKELFGLISDSFRIVPALSDEVIDYTLSEGEIVKSLAGKKAKEVSEGFPNSVVVGADTMVFCQGKALGKPKDSKDAEEMLTFLSGKVHSVYTGVAVANKGNILKAFSEETEVEFYPLSSEEIKRYADSGEPMDKAGAYGIQGKGALLIKGIRGDYYNVMGLPVGRLYRELEQILNSIR